MVSFVQRKYYSFSENKQTIYDLQDNIGKINEQISVEQICVSALRIKISKDLAVDRSRSWVREDDPRLEAKRIASRA